MYFVRVIVSTVLLLSSTFAQEDTEKLRKPKDQRRNKIDVSRVDYWGRDLPADCHVPKSSYIGNGFCGGGRFNNEECNWDGGDCCEDTCIDGQYKCGKWSAYNCKKPAVIASESSDSSSSSSSSDRSDSSSSSGGSSD